MESLYVDGCCNKQTKGNGWASVVADNNIDLIDAYSCILSDFIIEDVSTPKGKYKVIISKFNDVASQQNNGAELLSMVAGLRIAVNVLKCKFLYSDSSLMVDYWSDNKISKKTLDKMDPIKLKYIKECYTLRKRFELCGGKVLKIPGNKNPADLGYHK